MKKSTVPAGVKIFAVVKCKSADAVSWLTDKFPLALILPEAVIWPLSFTLILPENVWISSSEFPNCVEPLVKIIEAETNSVWNSWAVIVPVTVKSPVNVSVVFSK